MPPPQVVESNSVNPACTVPQELSIVGDPHQLSRRDFIKLASLSAVAYQVLTACGPGAVPGAGESAQTGSNEIPIPNPKEVPGFGNPKRPWIFDVSTGEVTPVSPELPRIMSDTFPRWVNINNPLVELHPGKQMVARVLNNGGLGTELGVVTSNNARDLEAEIASSGWSWGDGAVGEKFVRPDSSGMLTAFMDYQMTAPKPSSINVAELVKPGRDIGDIHVLKNMYGDNFKLPGNVQQVASTVRMLSLLFSRIVTDNVLSLPEPERFAQYNAAKTRLIDNILTIPEYGEPQATQTAEMYLSDLQFDLSNPQHKEEMMKGLLPVLKQIASVDNISIPSAKLAVAIAMGLANGERINGSEKINALEKYADSDLPEGAVVPFTADAVVDKAVESEWQRIPLSKPRAFVVTVQNYRVDHAQGSPMESKGFERKVIFVNYDGERVTDTQKKGDGQFEALFTHQLFNMDPRELTKQRLIESTEKDNVFFSVKKRSDKHIETGQHVVELKEVDTLQVRLFLVPGGGMKWGVETNKSGKKPYGFGANVESMLGGQNFQVIPYQEIVMEDGSLFKSEVEGYLNKGWATDITERWYEWKRKGIKEVTKMSLRTPDQYLSRIADGAPLQPQSDLLRDTLLGRYAVMDVTNADLDSLKTNNVVAALDLIPLYQVSGGNGIQVDYVKPGDVLTYDNAVTVVNGEPMLRLFNHAGYEYAIPIDFAKIQLIDNGTWDRIVQTAKEVLPIALLLIPYGKLAGKGLSSLLKLVTKK